MNTRPLAQMALQIIQTTMEKDAAYKKHILDSPIISQVIQTTMKARADNLQLIKAIIVLLRKDPDCVIVVSLQHSHTVEFTAELQDDGHLIMHADMLQRTRTVKQSSYWNEDDFARDTIDMIVRHPPKTVEVQRCPLLGVLGKMPHVEFVRVVEEMFGPLPQRKRWNRMHTETCIHAPR